MKLFFLLVSVGFALVNGVTWKNLLESAGDGADCDVSTCVQKCPPAAGIRNKLTTCLQTEGFYEKECVNGTELVARMQANIQSGGVAKNRMFLFRRFNVQSDVAESCKTNCGKAFDCFKNKCSATVKEDAKLFSCLKQIELSS